MEENDYLPLFETKEAKGRRLYWFYALSMVVGISFTCIYRVSNFPQENGLKRWAWTGIFMAELWFIVYWVLTQFARYHAVFRYTFKDRLSRRYKDVHPGIDIFVSTADPQLEPPLMVVDTVLSVMAYDYPSEKLNVYLTDDGCSDLMFYALLEASKFSRHWLPFCRNFGVEPRAPGVYFSTVKEAPADHLRKHHKGFSEWELGESRSDHHTILQVQSIPSEWFNNVDTYTMKVELPALDAHGGPLYIGSGCFHRRDALTGKKYEKGSQINWKQVNAIQEPERELEETVKFLANCNYEENSSWGKEMGLKYGCPVEDVVTGLSIKCKGWRSIFFNPERKSFMGAAPTTLLTTLIQHTRWSEGHFQIFLSKYCPLIYGHGKIPVQLQISYVCFNLWAANCLATLYYVSVLPFCFLKGINLFPQLSSSWVLPYAYVFIAKYTYSLGEFLWSGGTVKGWYNDQRMWLYKRVTCYLYGFCQTILRSMGFANLSFAITRKNVDDDVSKRFEQEIMEFGTASSMFIILATIALFNLLTLFEALFLRRDQGCMPASVTYKSLIFAAIAYLLTMY